MTKEEELFTAIGLKVDGSAKSQMFGKPCFKVGGKAYVSFFQDEMVFKLEGDAHKAALSLDGAQLFNSSGKGRPMKEWVQVPYSDHEQWSSLAVAARAYVYTLNNGK